MKVRFDIPIYAEEGSVFDESVAAGLVGTETSQGSKVINTKWVTPAMILLTIEADVDNLVVL